MNLRLAKFGALITALAVTSTVSVSSVATAQTESLLDKVKTRGSLVCGVNPGIPGFGFLDTVDNTFKGFDPDFCRVVAAAVLGDATKVEFSPIAAAADRFPALASGSIDVLIRNTTFTASRDSKEGADYAPTTFYDASTVMVRTADDLATLEDLKDLTLCAIKGTTNERAISEEMTRIGVSFKLQTFDNIDAVIESFDASRCDGVTSDRSQLAGKRSAAANGGDWTILDFNLTKEPLGPAVKQGDSKWLDAVSWAIYATMIAEEKGITSANVDEVVANTEDPETRRLLGLDETSDIYSSIGFTDPKWAYNVIKQVGNYSEIFDRNLGEQSLLKLPRGLNALWTNDGLLYPPPFR